MRISDWSSDVCSSDLTPWPRLSCGPRRTRKPRPWRPPDLDFDGGGCRPCQRGGAAEAGEFLADRRAVDLAALDLAGDAALRSERRRVGKECVRTWSTRWCPDL